MESESTVYTEADLSRGDYNRGVYYLAIGWVLTSIAIIVVCTRLYSRAYITRSIGSDDYAVVISMVRPSCPLHTSKPRRSYCNAQDR